MDRQIVYPGSIPLDTDLLNAQRNTLIAFGFLAQATLGSGTVVDGLACSPTTPASLNISVGPGSITSLSVVDQAAYGSLGADPTDPLVKMGINVSPVPFSLAAPTTSGQSVNFLIQVSLIESDGLPIVLPYYNAANPAQPFSGSNNSGLAQNTQRTERVQIQVKSGVPAQSGTQVTPPVDNGWVGLYVVSLTYGQTSITSQNIQALAGAPFIYNKLPQLTPGYRNMALFNVATSGTWTPTAGTSVIKLRLWGGGGAGGSGGGGAGGGGAGGGYNEGYYQVTAGLSYAVAVGSGGTASASQGGATSFGGLASASGGAGGSPGGTGSAGAGANSAGAGFGTGITMAGGVGQPGVVAGLMVGGAGGASYSNHGGPAVFGPTSANATGQNAVGVGSGGSGGLGNGIGGNGSPGLVIVEW